MGGESQTSKALDGGQIRDEADMQKNHRLGKGNAK